MKCKVSIITVVRNGANTIEQTIKSVLKQTYKNIEYIVIDGASTDGTKKIIEKYYDSIAVYISEEDAGLYYAMNKGIRIATGEIVGIINSDDWYSIDAVETAVKCIEQNDVDVLYGKIVRIAKDGKEKMIYPYPLENMWYQMAPPHPSVFIRKSTYDKFGAFDVNYKIAADYELMLRLYCNNVKFRYVDKIMAYFRAGGLSMQRHMEVFNEGYRISMAYLDKCPCKDVVQPKIEAIYSWACFGERISNVKGALYELVCRYFNLEINQLVIFGSGVWGERCSKSLVDSGTEVVCFVDNDSSKWGTKFCGVEVVSADRLKGTEAYVLIASELFGQEMKEQLNSMSNKRLRCVTLDELMELWINDSSLEKSRHVYDR